MSLSTLAVAMSIIAAGVSAQTATLPGGFTACAKANDFTNCIKAASTATNLPRCLKTLDNNAAVADVAQCACSALQQPAYSSCFSSACGAENAVFASIGCVQLTGASTGVVPTATTSARTSRAASNSTATVTATTTSSRSDSTTSVSDSAVPSPPATTSSRAAANSHTSPDMVGAGALAVAVAGLVVLL